MYTNVFKSAQVCLSMICLHMMRLVTCKRCTTLKVFVIMHYICFSILYG